MRITTVRPLDLSDDTVAKAVHAVGQASYAVEARLIGYDGIPALREGLAELRARPLRWLGAHTPGGELAGFVAWAEDTDGGTVIDRLCVDPGRFRQGIGAGLLGSLLAEVPAGRPVSVTTGAANTPALALYGGLGFGRGADVEPEPGVRLASFTRPPTPARLVPLLAQYEHASARLLDRMAGPVRDSGNGQEIGNAPMTDAEYFREPVPGCWSVRRRPDGRWGRDTAPAPHPVPPPFTTLAWRLSHLTEMLALRSDHTDGTRSLVREEFDPAGDAESAVASYAKAATAWRSTLLRVDDAALDTVGYSRYPYGSDAEDLFLEIVWWVNQEVLHHGAEIALLRDLYASHPDR